MKILVAGGTGYLGRHILVKLSSEKFDTVAIYRNNRINSFNGINGIKYIKADVRNINSLKGLFKGIDIVVSTIGITRQKDGLTYYDVDYAANLNLLKVAEAEGVNKFIYVSSLNGHLMKDLKLCKAKEMFVDTLKSSTLKYQIIRPNGFFSDFSDFLELANHRKIFLFGNGNFKVNPIDGSDLADYIIKNLGSNQTEFNVGGPKEYTHNEIVSLASIALNKKIKTIYLPLLIKDLLIKVLRFTTFSTFHGPIEFFLTTMSRDMLAPKYGVKVLSDFFKKISS